MILRSIFFNSGLIGPSFCIFNFTRWISSSTTPFQVPTLTIYPNPAADIFTIVLQEGNAINTLIRLDILNMQGQVVFHDTLSNFPTPQLVWKNEGLPSGTYLIHVYSDGRLIGEQKIVLH